MRLSPLDIKKHEFNRALRGYDAEEVQAFLDMMAGQWEDVQADLRRSDERVRELQSKMAHYERVEEALQEALQTARDNAKQALDNAKEEAKLIVQRAMGEAEDLTRSATQQRDDLDREVEDLHRRRDAIVAKLRAFLTAEVEILGRYDSHELLRASQAATGEAGPPVNPTVTTETNPAMSLVSVVLDPPETTGHLPILDLPDDLLLEPPHLFVEENAPAPADDAPPAAQGPDEVPLEADGLDVVLEEVAAPTASLPPEDAHEPADEPPVPEATPEAEADVMADAEATDPADPDAVAASDAVAEEAVEVEEVAAVEDAVEVEEVVVVEDAPVAEEVVVVEEAVEVEEVAAVEEAAVVEEAVEVEEAAVVEDAPEAEDAPVAEEAAGATDVVMEAPASDEAPASADAEAGRPERDVPSGGLEIEFGAEAGYNAHFYVPKEPLDAKFFDPVPGDQEQFYQEERDVPRFGPDRDSESPAFDPYSSNDTWIVRPAEPAQQPHPPPAEGSSEESIASPEEIEKIKRILSDLE